MNTRKTLNPMTEADLYCIGMESDTAYRLMPQLCEMFGCHYPPRLTPPANPKRVALLGYHFQPRLAPPSNAKRDAIPCPFKETA